MPAKILHSVKRNSESYWSLMGRKFLHTGVHFEVVGSTSTGSGPYDVVHTVKNLDKGTYADIEMKKLIEILKTADE